MTTLETLQTKNDERTLNIVQAPRHQKLKTNKHDLVADLQRVQSFCGWQEPLHALPVCNDLFESTTTTNLLSHETHPKSRRTMDLAPKAKEAPLD